MADSISFDFSEITSLAADLGTVAADAGRRVGQAVEISARNVKDAWAAKLEGTPDVPHGARTITYDIEAVPGEDKSSVSAVIGAEDGREQAPIVAVLEFGAPGNNLPPHGYGAAALQETEGDFQKGLELAVGDPLE